MSAHGSTAALSGARAVTVGKTCRRIIMIGTRTDTSGGIATVVRGYQPAGLFDRFDIVYVATHRDGSAWRKALAGLSGWLGVARELVRAGAPLLHIHLSSRASFWRQFVVCLEAR